MPEQFRACRSDGTDPSITMGSFEAAAAAARSREREAHAHGDTTARYVVQSRPAPTWSTVTTFPKRAASEEVS